MKMTVTNVVVDRVALAVKRAGRGMPVVCLTAVGHDAEDFLPLAERVGEQCELICVEWPSHGGSGRDHLEASAARYVELIAGALSTLNIRPAVIVGNSIGGAAAILYASQHALQGLVLCDSGGLVEVTPAVRRFCGWFEKFFAGGERGAWWFGPLFAVYYRLVLTQKAARAQRRRIVAHARERAPALRQAWASFGNADADIRAIAAGLDTPIWVAWAARDRVIPLRVCLPAIRKLKHYILDTFVAGHSAFLEQPDEFAGKFLSFIAKTQGFSRVTADRPAAA